MEAVAIPRATVEYGRIVPAPTGVGKFLRGPISPWLTRGGRLLHRFEPCQSGGGARVPLQRHIERSGALQHGMGRGIEAERRPLGSRKRATTRRQNLKRNKGRHGTMAL